MSTLKVNNIESYTGADPVNINDQLQISGSTASGFKSFTHGLDTKATVLAHYSHAEGHNTLAIGAYSHAEGRQTTASAYYSHAEGYNTEASGTYQLVVGQYNEATSDRAAFIIGNGGPYAKSNLAVFASESIKLDEDALPTTDPGVPGQLYTTSSALFGGPAALKVLMIST